MSARWTVDEDGYPVLVDGPEQLVAWVDASSNEWIEAGVSALVDAVRDADTLARARELAQRCAHAKTLYGLRAYGINDLLDLLTDEPDQ